MNRLLSAILRGPWLLDPNWAQAQLPYINNLLEGKVAVDGKAEEISFEDLPKFVDRSTGEMTSVMKAGKWGADFSNAAPGSIAIIPINGPIMKYNGECGEPGSIARASWIDSADKSPNISSIVLLFDTPGGQVDGTQTLANTIKNSQTPVIGFIDDGMCASAGVWMASGCKEIYAGLKTDMIGSIGVYTRLIDAKGAYEAKGFKIHEIYAPQSTEKNLDYKKALEGDYALIENELKFIASEFIGAVKANRKGKLSFTKDNDPFKGAMFNAEQALEIGLIDGIKSFNEVLLLADEYGKNNSSNNANKNNMNLFGKSFKAIEALSNKKAAEITTEEKDAANKELNEAGITGAVLVTLDEHETFATLQSDLKQANDKNAAVESALTAAGFESVDKLVESHTEWKNKAIEYGAKVDADRTTTDKGGESEINTDKKEALTSWEEKAARRVEY